MYYDFNGGIEMNIAVLSGAYGNAGDSLIEFRCKRLLENTYGDNSIKLFLRKDIGENLERINECDLVVFSGGPIYQKDISRNFNIEDALKIKKPLAVIGGGWRGAGRCLIGPYKYRFTLDTKALFNKINGNNGLSCRDLYTVKALKGGGIMLL